MPGIPRRVNSDFGAPVVATHLSLAEALHMSESNPTSPSIPTPSIVNPPSSKSAQNEIFEALVNLLASDGIDCVPSTSTIPRSNTGLRDHSGRLDFEKICSMFETRNHRQSTGGGVPNNGEGGVPGAVLDRPRVEKTIQASLDVHQARRVC